MLSPHARARQRSLFIMSLDADRARWAAGLPEPDRMPVAGRRLVTGENLIQRMRASIQAAVQATYFTGG